MSAPQTNDHGGLAQHNACNYATLSHYNNGMTAGMQVPLRKGDVIGSYIVPAWGAAGYATLTHGGAQSCGGYFDIDDAYKSKGGSCNTQFVRKLCQ